MDSGSFCRFKGYARRAGGGGRGYQRLAVLGFTFFAVPVEGPEKYGLGTLLRTTHHPNLMYRVLCSISFFSNRY